MEFSKWHGIGNDFIIIDDMAENIENPCDSGKALCDRHKGIGADGLLLIRPSSVADYYMLIINSDGTVAEMCGNATRCFARHLSKYGYCNANIIKLETPAGIKTAELLPDGRVCVDLGTPGYTRGAVPLSGDARESSLNVTVDVEGRNFTGNGISMGNPHFVIFAEDAEELDLERLGRQIERHRLFPVKTNVEFVKIIDRNTLRMRVWERGCGVTLACGTGSAAALAAAVLTGRTERQARILLDGGELQLEWASNGNIYKTGPATEVFRGTLLQTEMRKL